MKLRTIKEQDDYLISIGCDPLVAYIAISLYLYKGYCLQMYTHLYYIHDHIILIMYIEKGEFGIHSCRIG